MNEKKIESKSNQFYSLNIDTCDEEGMLFSPKKKDEKVISSFDFGKLTFNYFFILRMKIKYHLPIVTL